MPGAVQVVAHLGASAVRPEHTLQAFEAAVRDGVDALGCDVRLTRDGVLVCVHDRRVDRPSDGRGVASSLELADLADLDFASWVAPLPSHRTLPAGGWAVSVHLQLPKAHPEYVARLQAVGKRVQVLARLDQG